MIVVAGSILTKPDHHDAVVAAANAMMAATLQEPGCQAYQFSFATDDPARVCMFEYWDDMAALDAHFETPHMAVFQSQLGDLVAGAGSFRTYEVTSSAKFR